MHPFDENKRAWRVVGHLKDGRRVTTFVNAETPEQAQDELALREPVLCVEVPVEIDGKTGKPRKQAKKE